MSEKYRKKFQPLGADLICEVKSITEPIDDTTTMHNHSCHEILVVKAGRLILFTDHSGIELEHGDVAMIPTYMFHRGQLLTRDTYDRVVINVSENVIDSASSAGCNLNKCFKPYNDRIIHTVHLDDNELDEMYNYCNQLSSSLFDKTPESEVLTDAYLKLILIMINRKYRQNEIVLSPDKMPDIVRKAFDYIDKHLTEEITLKTLEDELHNNGTYISRCVKKVSGMSISNYIIARRIALACRHLREGKTANEACYLSGFNNYSNFSRTFSKQVGVSPKQFQIMYRQGVIANT